MMSNGLRISHTCPPPPAELTSSPKRLRVKHQTNTSPASGSNSRRSRHPSTYRNCIEDMYSSNIYSYPLDQQITRFSTTPIKRLPSSLATNVEIMPIKPSQAQISHRLIISSPLSVNRNANSRTAIATTTTATNTPSSLTRMASDRLKRIQPLNHHRSSSNHIAAEQFDQRSPSKLLKHHTSNSQQQQHRIIVISSDRLKAAFAATYEQEQHNCTAVEYTQQSIDRLLQREAILNKRLSHQITMNPEVKVQQKQSISVPAAAATTTTAPLAMTGPETQNCIRISAPPAPQKLCLTQLEEEPIQEEPRRNNSMNELNTTQYSSTISTAFQSNMVKHQYMKSSTNPKKQSSPLHYYDNTLVKETSTKHIQLPQIGKVPSILRGQKSQLNQPEMRRASSVHRATSMNETNVDFQQLKSYYNRKYITGSTLGNRKNKSGIESELGIDDSLNSNGGIVIQIEQQLAAKNPKQQKKLKSSFEPQPWEDPPLPADFSSFNEAGLFCDE